VDDSSKDLSLASPEEVELGIPKLNLLSAAASLLFCMPNLKDEIAAGAVRGLEPGRISSHELHLSFASGFLTIQVGQSH